MAMDVDEDVDEDLDDEEREDSDEDEVEDGTALELARPSSSSEQFHDLQDCSDAQYDHAKQA